MLDRIVIIELEVIEQIEAEPKGRPLFWVCDLIQRMGRSDPLAVLHGMWLGGYVGFVDNEGQTIPQWKCAELFRKNDNSVPVRVVTTALGSSWVHG